MTTDPHLAETLGLYISVPFCRAKCSFCNFASGVYPASYFERYVDRLIDDIGSAPLRTDAIGARLPTITGSIYLGGGTPSILPPALLGKLFRALGEGFNIAPTAEITVECAPGQLDDDALAAMVESGVNRISFGVQSFVDREAAASGRLHTRQVALGDIERARNAGIRSISVDLIAGLPLQTAPSWRESLHVLAATGVSHASVYMFEVDDDSRLGSEVLSGGVRYHAGAVPSDDSMADFYSEAVEFLARRGLAQYEISNFARPGSESLHNLRYWQRRPYLGFGVDAHSMLRGSDGAAMRFGVTGDLEQYLRDDSWPQPHRLTREEELEEAWFLGLRMVDGVQPEALRAEFGPDAEFAELLDELATDGLVERRRGRVRLTNRGRLLSNEVFERFLASKEAELVRVI